MSQPSLEELLVSPTVEIVGDMLYDVEPDEEFIAGDDDDDEVVEDIEYDQNGAEIGRRRYRRSRGRGRKRRSVKVYRKKPKAKLFKGIVGLDEIEIPQNSTKAVEIRPKVEVAPYKLELSSNAGLNSNIFLTGITRGQTNFLVNGKAPITSFRPDSTEARLGYPVINKTNSVEMEFENKNGFDVIVTGIMLAIIDYKIIV